MCMLARIHLLLKYTEVVGGRPQLVLRFNQKEDAAAGNLWRKKLVLHGTRVVDDDFVGYSENPMPPPPGKGVGFPTAKSLCDDTTRGRRRWPAVFLPGGVPLTGSPVGKWLDELQW